jgi:hypothetical protein
MPESSELAEVYEELLDGEELLYRQVHPRWFDEGVPSAQAFYPTRKDAGRLSIARGSLTDPASAFNHYTTARGFQSAGTWGVSVQEVNAAPSLVKLPPQTSGNNAVTLPSRLACREEPLIDDPAHGFVDFRSLSNRACELIGKVLLSSAVARGCLHSPP